MNPKRLIQVFNNHELGLQERLFRLLVTIGLMGLAMGILVGLVLGESMANTLSLLVVFALAVAITYFSIHFHKIQIGAVLISVLLIYFALPFNFLTSGGIYGGGPIWLMFGVVFACLVVEKKAKYILIASSFCLYGVCYLIAYLNPQIMGSHTIHAAYADSFFTLAAVTVLVCSMILFQNAMYRKENKIAKEQKKEIEELNRMQNHFFSSMSHEIRTPINTIIGLNEMILREEISDEAAGDAKSIQGASKMLLTLINDILDMSRIESGKIHLEETAISLSEMLHDLKTIISGQIHAKQLELYMDAMDVTNEDVYCDKTRLNQVLLNLLSNAVKFTPAGGTVSVRLKQFPGKTKDSGLYEIRVKDSGIGMSPEFVQKIFSPFERERTSTVSRTQGTGLGMAITKNIVDMMGGTIEVQTEQGKGTEFIVRLALRLQPEHRRTEKIAELEGLKALVVDDDFNTCDSVTKMLVKVGMRSEWTLFGKEAVLRARQSLELGDAFHAYIIDWRLPDMNGIEVTRQIRSLGDDTPIIILTAYDWSDIETEARAAGVTAFCAKPLFMSDIRETLLTAIGQKKDKTETSVFPAADLNFRGRSVLLVEDNELNSEIAVEILNEYGFVVDTAENGAEAVEKVKNARPGDYDLVLMDVQMPVMDGYEATRQIRALADPALAGITILAMTANAFDEDRKKALECGMDSFLSKPIVIEELICALQNSLKHHLTERTSI